jgi:hypothetical protein
MKGLDVMPLLAADEAPDSRSMVPMQQQTRLRLFGDASFSGRVAAAASGSGAGPLSFSGAPPFLPPQKCREQLGFDGRLHLRLQFAPARTVPQSGSFSGRLAASAVASLSLGGVRLDRQTDTTVWDVHPGATLSFLGPLWGLCRPCWRIRRRLRSAPCV